MFSIGHPWERPPRGPGGGPGAPPSEPAVDLRTPVDEAAYVVFDTELTGLKSRRDSIVSIGAVRMAGPRILVGQSFRRLVRPRTELTGTSIVIHGITPAETRNCPGIECALPEFLEFCRGGVLVGHGVSLDLRFVNEELRRRGAGPIANPAVDTMALSAYLWKREGAWCAFHEEQPGPSDLFSLAAASGIPVNHAHDAAYDAYVTAQLFQRHLAVLPKHGVRTLADLIKVGRP